MLVQEAKVQELTNLQEVKAQEATIHLVLLPHQEVAEVLLVVDAQAEEGKNDLHNQCIYL
jgi:hypothetical protein